MGRSRTAERRPLVRRDRQGRENIYEDDVEPIHWAEAVGAVFVIVGVVCVIWAGAYGLADYLARIWQ